MDKIRKVRDKMKDQQHIHYYYINKEALLDSQSIQCSHQVSKSMNHLYTDKFKEDNH